MNRPLAHPTIAQMQNELPARAPTFVGCNDLRSDFARIERMQLEAMSRAFRPHGGFMSSDDVAYELRCVCDQPISRVARWIVSRSVISVSWRAQTLMPAFQFDSAKMSIVPGVTHVLQELHTALDNWEMALWFAAPNAWLDHAAPVALVALVALVADDASSVVQAARTDRLIAPG